MPKAFARCATAVPVLPSPMISTVLPSMGSTRPPVHCMRLLAAGKAAQILREGEHGAERIFGQHPGGDAGGIGHGQPGRVPAPEMVRARPADRHPFDRRAVDERLARGKRGVPSKRTE